MYPTKETVFVKSSGIKIYNLKFAIVDMSWRMAMNAERRDSNLKKLRSPKFAHHVPPQKLAGNLNMFW